ncbi:hypothetical protein JKP88DRAFT_334553 [Tribonema minus]|uniref:Uncharacterized protein n=1 Tax=Tribonema minus TaxID=303371 RepID=A0A835YUG9_9STRA|nr:hypothetical protein JKP88DRAFT_334553 [Tribonema minus]
MAFYAAETAFRAAVQEHLSRLMQQGMPRSAAIDTLLVAVRGQEANSPLASAAADEVAALVAAHGYSHQDAVRALVVTQELRSLREQGLDTVDALNILTSRVARAQPPAPTAVPPPPQQLPQQQHQHTPCQPLAAQTQATGFQQQQQQQPMHSAEGVPHASPARLPRASPRQQHQQQQQPGALRRKRAEWEAQSALPLAGGKSAAAGGRDDMEWGEELGAGLGVAAKRARKEAAAGALLQQPPLQASAVPGSVSAAFGGAGAGAQSSLKRSLDTEADDAGANGSTAAALSDGHKRTRTA